MTVMETPIGKPGQPETESVAASAGAELDVTPRLWLGYWRQPEVGRHAYCNMWIRYDVTTGRFAGEFMDQVGNGKLEGYVWPDGWVTLTRLCPWPVYYLGRIDGETIAGAWVMSKYNQWPSNNNYRSSGVFKIWAMSEDSCENNLDEAFVIEPSDFKLRCVTRSYMEIHSHFPALRKRIEQEQDPAVKAVLTRQLHYWRARHARACTMISPLDNQWVDPDPAIRRQTDQYWGDLSFEAAEALFLRINQDAANSIQHYRQSIMFS